MSRPTRRGVNRRVAAVAALAAGGLAAVTLSAPQAHALPSVDVVISEVYNTGAQPVDLSGWSVQYASTTGSSWQVTPRG